MEDDDLSGSTGVVVVYDGRRNVLTVANVGDSMVSVRGSYVPWSWWSHPSGTFWIAV